MRELLNSVGSGLAWTGAAGGMLVAGAGVYKLMVNEGCHVIDGLNKVVFIADDLVPGPNLYDDFEDSPGLCATQDDLRRLKKEEDQLDKQASADTHQSSTGRIALKAQRNSKGEFMLEPAAH